MQSGSNQFFNLATSLPSAARVRMWLLVFALVIAAGTLLIISNLSYDGFCFRDRRFLSEKEYFAAAIASMLKRETEQLVSYGPKKVRFSVVHVVKYAGMDDFLQQNPDCCKVVPHNTGDLGPYTSFDQRLFGYAAKIVSINYIIRYVDEIGDQKSVTKTEQLAVTNCGRAWH